MPAGLLGFLWHRFFALIGCRCLFVSSALTQYALVEYLIDRYLVFRKSADVKGKSIRTITNEELLKIISEEL